MAPKLSKLKTNPDKSRAPDDMESTIHDVEKSVPAIAPLEPLGPIGHHPEVEPFVQSTNKDMPVTCYVSEVENTKSDLDKNRGGDSDAVNTAITDPCTGDFFIERKGEGSQQQEQLGDRPFVDPDSDDDIYQLSDEGDNKTSRSRISTNADEYVELSNERAREARVKQQLFSTSVKVMYVDRLRSAPLENRLHRAVYRGDEDEVRRLILGRGLDLTKGPAYVDDIETGIVDKLDKMGRSALHIAAGGNTPGIVDIIFLQARIEFEKIKNQEMKRLKVERRECLQELKKAFHDNLGIDRSDYRIQAVEKWFENEVARLHRRAELQAENSWLRLITTRDSSGMTPVHHCVSTGSVSVMEALLRPIPGGRGDFTLRDGYYDKNKKLTSPKRKLKQEFILNSKVPGNEWFDTGAIYNLNTGNEVVALDQFPTHVTSTSLSTSYVAPPKYGGMSGTQHVLGDCGFNSGQTVDDIVRSSYTLLDVAFADKTIGDTPPTVDYEVIIPWLVRSIHKRSSEMGARLGATGLEILEEIVDIVDATGTRALVLPEINRLLGLLGIVVTRDVVKELCHMYPAAIDVIEEKWVIVRGRTAPSSSSKHSDRKPSGSKRSCKGSARSAKGSHYSDNDDEQDDTAGAFERGEKIEALLNGRWKRGRILQVHLNGAYDIRFDDGTEDSGFIAHEIRSRENKRNPFVNLVDDCVDIDSKSSSHGGKRTTLVVMDEDEEFGLDFDKLVDDIVSGRGMRSAITSNSSLFGTGNKKGNTVDEGDIDDIAELTEQHERSVMEDIVSLELPPMLNIAAIYKCRKYAVNARDVYGNTPVLVAAAMSRREHLELLLRAGGDISILSNDGHSALAVATDACIISSVQKELVAIIKKNKTALIKNGFASLSSTIRAKSSLQDTHSSLKDANQRVLQSCGDPESLLVQLQNLQKKRWGYSQGCLMWALESGTSEVMQKLLSAGADPNEKNVMGRTALHECMSMASRIVANDVTELDLAASSLFTLRSIAESLIMAGANVNIQTSSGRTPLHELFCRGQDSTQDISSPSKRSVKSNTRTSAQLSRTSVGIVSGHATTIRATLERLQSLLVRSLIQWDADALLLDRHGYNAMFYCARENMPNSLVEILKSGVNINYQCPRGRTVLHIACIHGSSEAASVICKWDADNKMGIQCIRDSSGKVARDLIFGMDAIALTTLWQACRDGNSMRVNEVLSKGHRKGGARYENMADVEAGIGDTVDNDLGLSHRVLTETAEGGARNQDLWLLDGVDAKTRCRKWTALHACVIGWGESSVLSGNASAQRALELSTASPVCTKKLYSRKANKKTEVRRAKDDNMKSFPAVVSVLLQNYAYVDSMDGNYRTPLMFAAACNLPECVSLLCTGGSDVNLRDAEGNTALHYANAYGSIAAASVLESKGADRTLTNNKKLMPDDILGQCNEVPRI